MTVITITGDATQEALQHQINALIQTHGSDLVIQISENLRFENQTKAFSNVLTFLKIERNTCESDSKLGRELVLIKRIIKQCEKQEVRL